jgi:predicted ABC-type sugar transport system permease subunit
MIAPGGQEALISIGFLGGFCSFLVVLLPWLVVLGFLVVVLPWLVVRTTFIVKSAGN